MYTPSKNILEHFAKYGTWWVNYKTSEVNWSEGVFNIIGIKPTNIDFNKSAKIFHPKHRQLFIDSSLAVYNGEEKFDIELIAITQQGEKWVRATGEPIIENNERIGVFGIILDIDKYKKKEIELINNEATINAILSNTDAKIWSVDTNYKYLAVNKSYKELIFDLCGYYPKNGSHIFHAAFGADENKIFYDYYDRGLNGESFTVDSYYSRKGKAKHDMLSFSPIISNNEITGVTVFAIDLSNKVDFEKEIEQQKLFFETILNSISNEIWVISTQKKLVFANKSALLKYKVLFNIDFNIGMDALMMFSGKSAEFKKEWDEYYDLAIKGEKFIINKTIAFGEEKRYYSFEFNPIYSIDKKITGTVVIGNDTTNATRTSIVLQKAKEKAEDAAKLKSQYLSVMSHEVRTPLNAILGITNILLAENHTTSQKEHLKTLKFSSEHLLTIVNDVLDYAKFDSGEISFELIEFNLREIIGQIGKTFQHKIKEKKLKYLTTIDDNIPENIIGDPTRLSQVLINLIGNAVKFTETGSVELDIKLNTFSTDLTSIKFEIRDTGIGIPQNKIHEIFEPFKQSSSETTRRFGGTGLGLAICSRILSLQKSTFKIKSKVNVGTSFSFILDFKNAITSTTSSENTLPANELLKGYKILIAEDNSINQYILEKYLSNWGASSNCALNGQEALEMIASKEYDLVLMDIQMPIMNGYEATEAIRAIPDSYFKEIPIYALSAEVYSDVIKKVKKSGMNEMIEKPFKPEKLLSLIIQNKPELISKKSHKKSAFHSDVIDFDNLIEYIGEDEAFMKEYLNIVATSLSEFIVVCKDLIYTKNHIQLKELLHKVKPTFTILGNKNLMTIYAKIRNNDYLDSLDYHQINELEIETENTVKEIIEAIYNKISSLG